MYQIAVGRHGDKTHTTWKRCSKKPHTLPLCYWAGFCQPCHQTSKTNQHKKKALLRCSILLRQKIQNISCLFIHYYWQICTVKPLYKLLKAFLASQTYHRNCINEYTATMSTVVITNHAIANRSFDMINHYQEIIHAYCSTSRYVKPASFWQIITIYDYIYIYLKLHYASHNRCTAITH